MNVPVLARLLEAEGLSTLVVAPSPIWAEQLGTPRILGVEFPYGHTLGEPHHPELQRQVLGEALRLFQDADQPGAVAYSQAVWPRPTADSIEAWQPAEPSPIVGVLSAKIREMVRSRRSRES